MKKRILSLILAVALMATMTACGSKSSVDVLKEMDAANQSDTLVSTFGKVAYRYTYDMADDTVSNNYTYKDEKQHVIETDDYVMIDDSGDVYGFDNEKKRAFRYLFVGDAYEMFQKDWDYLGAYRYAGDIEKVTSQETKDGIIDIDTETTDEETINIMVAQNNYESSDVKKLLYSYEVDEKTYSLEQLIVTMEFADGTQKRLSACERVDNPETYMPDEQLKKTVFEGDLRTVTVTVDGGTDQEKVYTQTISKGNEIDLLMPEEYGEAYADATYTTLYESDTDLNKDLNLYVKSKG